MIAKIDRETKIKEISSLLKKHRAYELYLYRIPMFEALDCYLIGESEILLFCLATNQPVKAWQKYGSEPSSMLFCHFCHKVGCCYSGFKQKELE